jgi:hypothetical protein
MVLFDIFGSQKRKAVFSFFYGEYVKFITISEGFRLQKKQGLIILLFRR